MAEAEFFPRDDILKYNLEAFLPYICDCVKATDLLVHLHYFTREQRKEIFKMCVQNDVAAMRRAMEILMTENEDPGRFTAIRDAIESSQYPKIVQMLDGKNVSCDQNCQKIIDLFANEIIRRLNPEELLPKLVCQGTITHVDAEEVRAEERNHGKTRACWVLLFFLPNRVENWFRDFFEALLDKEYDDVAEILDPDLFKKITAQRMEAFSESSTSGIDDTKEYVLTDDTFETTIKKDNFEPAEKDEVKLVKDDVNTLTDNFKKEHEKSSKTYGLDTFLEEMSSPKLNESTTSKKLAVEDATKGKLRNEEGEDRCDSVTDAKVKAQGLEKKKEPDKRIKYTLDFLLSCKDSPLAKVFPKEVEKLPEIMVPISLPRKSEITAQRMEALSVFSTPGTDDTKEYVLKDDTTEKKNFKLARKNDVKLGKDDVNTLRDNFKKEFEKVSKTYGLDTFLEEMSSPKLNESTTCKKLAAENVTKGKLRNGEGEDRCDSVTKAREKAQGLEKKKEPGKRIKYTLGFLLSCKDSPLAKVFPKEVEVLPEIMVPISLQRKSDADNFKRGEASADTQNNLRVTPNDVVFENNFEDDVKADTSQLEETDSGLLDFENLLEESPGRGLQGDNEQAHIDHDRQEADGAAGRDFDTSQGNGILAELRRQELELKDFQEELNNLNIGGEQSYQDEADFNIITDADEVEAEDTDIELREYQKELAKEGSEGDNVIVMAPTNTGKTRVACRIMQVHLRRHRQLGIIGKVIFLVENEALALQQGKVCEKLLPAYRTKVISGSIQRDKKQYLRDFVDRRDILVVTAQVLLNALKCQEVRSITTFSMIVFDECHHTNNYHRFNEIMSFYMDLKLRQNLSAEKLPQIIGLTASLGVGGNTNVEAAMNHMKSLLANLDAKFLCTVRKNIEELRYYENNPVERIVAAKRRRNDLYREAILGVMDLIDGYMQTQIGLQKLPKNDEFIKDSSKVPATRGSEKFLQWLSGFKKDLGKLQRDSLRRMLNPCRIHLEVYNKALLIHADARIKDASAILEEFMEDERVITPKNDTDIMLLELYDNLKINDFNAEPENPKLVEMERIVLNVFADNNDARGIIFVKTRELALALVNWMKETASLIPLGATFFVGQVASKAEGGMTKSGQKDVLEYFKGGRHKIIIATSVAEEGLDITKCNLVIRYEHVTNEIVRLQSRGRARQQNSRYYVITEEGSWIVAKEEKNKLLEDVMNAVVPRLQVYIEDHPNLWEQELRQIQEKQKEEEELKEEQRFANMTNGEHQFRCLNCNNFICFLSDIRKIQGAHHVAISEDVPKRLISERNPQPKFMDEELKFDGAIHCGNKDCQRELGGVCEYKHAEFPLLKIKHFRIVDKNDKGATYKKWKKANFNVQSFTLDDLREVVERRRGEI